MSHPQKPHIKPDYSAANAGDLVAHIGRVLSVTPMDEWLPESELLYQAAS